MQHSSHRALQIYTKLAVLHILLANYFVCSCELPLHNECSKSNTPTNKTNIVDLNLTGCNHTHVWISWNWTTPTGCAIDKVVIRGYVCFLEDSSKLEHSDRTHFWPPGGELSLRAYYSVNMWNSYSTPVECNIDGYFEIEDSCEQKLLPVSYSITCSNSVQPTSTSTSLPITSSSLAPIMTTVQMTSILNSPMITVQLKPSIIPELQAHNLNMSSHTLSADSVFLSDTNLIWIIITFALIVLALVMVLLLLTCCRTYVVLTIKRWQNQNPSYYYNKSQMDFDPNFTPVIPSEAVLKDENLSVKSIIVPLEKLDKPHVDS